MYSKELFSVAQQGMISLIKTNIGMLMEVTESVWLIVKQNLSTLTSIFGTLLSLFLGGGQAVITFLVNAVSMQRINCEVFFLLFRFGSRLFS